MKPPFGCKSPALVVSLTSVCLVSLCFSADLRKPVPTRTQDAAPLEHAGQLQKQGKYEESLAEGLRILKANPDDIRALWIVGQAHVALKNGKQAISILQKGSLYDSPYRSEFFRLLGNIHFESNHKQAARFYRSAIEVDPSNAPAHFGLGMMLWETKDYKGSIESLQQAIRLKPDYTLAHAALGDKYMDAGYAIPALLAYARFLILAPAHRMAADKIADIRQILASASRQTAPTVTTTTVYLRLSGEGPVDQGDFRKAEMDLGLKMASLSGTPEVRLVTGYRELFQLLEKSNSLGSGFAPEFYVPYFIELHRQGMFEAFLDRAFRGAETAAGAKPDADAFLKWSKAYVWK